MVPAGRSSASAGPARFSSSRRERRELRRILQTNLPAATQCTIEHMLTMFLPLAQGILLLCEEQFGDEDATEVGVTSLIKFIHQFA